MGTGKHTVHWCEKCDTSYGTEASHGYVYLLYSTYVDLEPIKLPPKRHQSNKNLDL